MVSSFQNPFGASDKTMVVMPIELVEKVFNSMNEVLHTCDGARNEDDSSDPHLTKKELTDLYRSMRALYIILNAAKENM